MSTTPGADDTLTAICARCDVAIRQYDLDGGLWLTDKLGGGYDCAAGGLHTPVSTPTPVPAEVEGMTYTLVVADRCDRCGAQALVLTVHAGAQLRWCAHHYVEHEPKLRPHKVVDKRDTLEGASTTPA